MKCIKCNHNLPDDSEFCQYCGNKIEKNSITVEVTDTNKAKTEIKKETLKEDKKHLFEKMSNFKKSPKKPRKNIIIVLIIIVLIPIVCITTILTTNYFKASQIAENTVAIRLSKENNNYATYDDFTSFKKTYYTVKISDFKYIIELSGSAYMGPSNKTVSFFAKVKINPLTGNTSIVKLTFNGDKIKK